MNRKAAKDNSNNLRSMREQRLLSIKICDVENYSIEPALCGVGEWEHSDG